MESNIDFAKRKETIRFKSFDYSSVNAYFFTICTDDKKKYLDKSIQKTICETIEKVSQKYSVKVHAVSISSNHIHGLVTMPGNKEIISKFGMNPKKPDSFQLTNEPLMNNIMLWSGEQIELSDLIQSFFNVQVKTKLVAILLDLDPENWIGFAASWQQNNQTGQIILLP